MDRFWLLTWRTYGTWLPGDARGSVTRIREDSGTRMEHDIPGTPIDGPMPGLEESARQAMKSSPVLLTHEHAVALTEQFRETASYRGWSILASAVMSNHAHLVVGVPGDPEPSKLLGDFKAWGSRRLNGIWGRRTWWADHGSTRKLPDETAIRGAVIYVYQQAYSLVVWIADGWEPSLAPANGPASAGQA